MCRLMQRVINKQEYYTYSFHNYVIITPYLNVRTLLDV